MMKGQMIGRSVLLKASVRAGEVLGLTEKQLGALLGINPQAVNHFETHSREYFDQRTSELLIAFYKLLSATMGNDEQSMKHWMHTSNHHFNEIPLEMAQTTAGLERLVAYLESISR